MFQRKVIIAYPLKRGQLVQSFQLLQYLSHNHFCPRNILEEKIKKQSFFLNENLSQIRLNNISIESHLTCLKDTCLQITMIFIHVENSILYGKRNKYLITTSLTRQAASVLDY